MAAVGDPVEQAPAAGSYSSVDEDGREESDPRSATKRFRILLIGEGDFSFSRALCRILRGKESRVAEQAEFIREKLGLNITADILDLVDITSTSFDLFDDVTMKYSGASRIIDDLKNFDREFGRVELIDGVNACEIKSSLKDNLYDVIMWNHPHLGAENCANHRFLLAHLFYSAKQVLSKNGKINIALIEGQEERWGLFSQILRFGFVLLKRLPFSEHEWPGYVCRRNKTGDSFKNSRTRSHYNSSPMRSYLYQFALSGAASLNDPSQPADIAVHGTQDQPAENHTASVPSPRPTSRRKKALDNVPGDLTCKRCNRRLDSVRAYTQHVRSVHELAKFGENYIPGCEPHIPCPFSPCERKFRKYPDLRDHFLSKHITVKKDPQPPAASRSPQYAEYGYYPCDICGQAVSRLPDGLEDHMNSLLPIASSYLRCKNCPKVFIDSRSLEQHSIFCDIRKAPSVGC